MSADGKKTAKVVPLKGRKCPMCGKPATLELVPFCSKRCADLDLGRWLGGDYRLPTSEPTDQLNMDEDGDESDR